MDNNNAPFSKKAEKLIRNLTYCPNAIVDRDIRYELLSGGLTWRDETPDICEITTEDNGVLKKLWRYRSSIIEGKPQEELKNLWEMAKRNYPEWPIFRKVRQNKKWLKKLKEGEEGHRW